MLIKLMSFDNAGMHAGIVAPRALNLLPSVRGLDMLPQMEHGLKPAHAFRALDGHGAAVMLEQDVIVEVCDMSERARAVRAMVARLVAMDDADVHVEHAFGVEMLVAFGFGTGLGLDVRGYLEGHVAGV